VMVRPMEMVMVWQSESEHPSIVGECPGIFVGVASA